MGQDVDDQGARLLVKVAQLYHLQGQNQDQIGRQLGVSRSKVSRMLKEARERGLVEISIRFPARFSLDLERRLESELGLREAVVVNTGGMAGGQATGSVAGAASDYLMRVLQPDDVLGVSGGETVTLTAQVMPASAVEGVTVIQLGTAVAYLGERVAYSSAEVALQVAQKVGSMESAGADPDSLPSRHRDDSGRAPARHRGPAGDGASRDLHRCAGRHRVDGHDLAGARVGELPR